MNEVIVIGGGIAGIAAGYFFGKKKATVYEAQNRYGGLCDSINIGGFTFDKAVHVSFTSNQFVRQMFESVEHGEHIPIPYNYDRGYWLKHPVQNNLFVLPTEEKVNLISSFVQTAGKQKRISNYEEWLYQQYGKEITEKFYRPYTRKYWCMDPRTLSVDWIGKRVISSQLDQILLGAMTLDTPNDYYAKKMIYPIRGGFKSFLEPMAKKVDIRCSHRAELIDAKKKYVEFNTGEKVYYDRLIVSIPLPELVKRIKEVPDPVREAASRLNATSMSLVSVGFDVPDVAKYLWFYVYDHEFLPARVYAPGMKSLRNVPEGKSALQFEVYEKRENACRLGDAFLIDQVQEMIEKMKIASLTDIRFMKVHREEYANVIFDSDMKKNREILHRFLDAQEIEYIGRFGEWDYLWTDQSILSALKVAERTC